MNHVIPALIRLAAIGGAVLAYMFLVLSRWGEKGDANIGAGLVAFAGLVVVSFGWALLDATRHGFVPTAIRWTAVAVGIGVGWVVVMAFAEADGSMGVLDLIRVDAGLAVYIACMVGVPALVGAAVGDGARRGSHPPREEQH